MECVAGRVENAECVAGRVENAECVAGKEEGEGRRRGEPARRLSGRKSNKNVIIHFFPFLVFLKSPR